MITQITIGCGNALAAVVAVSIFRRFGPPRLALGSVRDVLVLLAATVIGAALAAAAGTGALLITGRVAPAAAEAVLTTWFFGDALGILTVGTLIVSVQEARREAWQGRSLLSVGALLLVLAAASAIVFFGPQAPRAWLVYPVLVCIALLDRVRGTAFGLLLLAVLASAGTMLGHGPFVPGGAGSADLALLQQYLAVTSVTLLLLAAAVDERDNQVRLREAVSKEVDAREALQRTTSLLNMVGETLPSMIYAKDRDGRFIYANRALLELYGCDLAGLLGRTDADFAGPEEAAEYRRNDHRIMAAGEAEEFEERVLQDGETRIYLSNKAPLRDEGGAVVGIVGVSTDVTDRHQQREQLIRLTQRAETAQRAARSSLYEMDLVTGAVNRDRLIAEVCGLAPDAIDPTQHGWEQHIHPDDLPAFRTTVETAVERFERFAMEYRVVATGGRHVWLADTGQIIRGEDGKPRRLIGLVMDITERKVAEEREHLLAREVDHRAKNLLAVVQSVVQLTRAEDAETLKADVTGRIQSLARAHSLLADSRWEGVDLAQLALEELAPFTQIDQHQVLVGGPQLRLKPAAAQSLALVLHELATNAAKYGAMSDGGGRLEVGWSLPDGGRVELVWREVGGPPARPPTRSGFGSRLIKASVERQLRGSVHYDWGKEGLQVRLTIPQDHVTCPPEAGASELHEVLE